VTAKSRRHIGTRQLSPVRSPRAASEWSSGPNVAPVYQQWRAPDDLPDTPSQAVTTACDEGFSTVESAELTLRPLKVPDPLSPASRARSREVSPPRSPARHPLEIMNLGSLVEARKELAALPNSTGNVILRCDLDTAIRRLKDSLQSTQSQHRRVELCHLKERQVAWRRKHDALVRRKRSQAARFRLAKGIGQRVLVRGGLPPPREEERPSQASEPVPERGGGILSPRSNASVSSAGDAGSRSPAVPPAPELPSRQTSIRSLTESSRPASQSSMCSLRSDSSQDTWSPPSRSSNLDQRKRTSDERGRGATKNGSKKPSGKVESSFDELDELEQQELGIRKSSKQRSNRHSLDR